MNSPTNNRSLLGASLLLAALSPLSLTADTYDFTTSGDWNLGTNWTNKTANPNTSGTVPGSSDLASIFSSSATPTTGTIGTATVNSLRVVSGGTLNIASTDNLTVKTSFSLGSIGSNSATVNQTGDSVVSAETLDISAGTSQATTSYTINDGELNLSSMAVGTTTSTLGNSGKNGTFTISGGSVSSSGAIRVGGSTAFAKGNFTVTGTSASVSADSMTLDATSTLRFNFGSTGVDDIALTNALTIIDGAKLVADGTSFSGGAGTYQLIDAGSISGGFLVGDITLQHFAGFTCSLSYLGNDVSLTLTAIPEPATYATLAGLGILGFAVCRRRKSAA